MHDVRAVLGVKAVAAIKSLSDFRAHMVIRNISSLIIFAGVAVGMFLLTRNFTGFLVNVVRVELEPLHSLLVVMMFGCFITVNFMSLILSYATLFTSREVEFLLGLPISHRKLFMIRMGENVLASSTVLFLISTAGVLGYGAAFRLSWYQYVVMTFGVMMPLIATAGILGVLLLTAFILLGGMIGARRMFLVAIVSYAAVLVASYYLTDPAAIIDIAVASAHGEMPAGAEPGVQSAPWLPHGMAAAALRSLILGDFMGSALAIAGVFAILLVLLLVAAAAGSRSYYSAWLLAHEMRTGHEGDQSVRVARLWDLRRQWTRRPNLEAVLKRDILQIARDPMQRIHILMMLALIIVTMVIGKMSILPAMKPFPAALSIVTVLLFDGFLVASVGMRLVFPAVSQEGRAFWCVRSAPIAVSRLYWLKFLLWLPILLIPAEALVWFTLPMAHAPRAVMLAASVAMVFMVVGLVSIHLGAGAFFATQREESPTKVATSQGASVTFLVSMAYLIAATSLMVLPVARFLETVPPPGVEAMLINAVLLMAGISLTAAVVAHAVGILALRKDF